MVLVKDRAEAIKLINQVAPEHLELCLDDAELMSQEIRHAGAIFMGRYTPEAIGDYCAGPKSCFYRLRVQRVFFTARRL